MDDLPGLLHALASERRRVEDRLRTLSADRLAPHCAAVRQAAQLLVDAAQDLEESGTPHPVRRLLPDLQPYALADLIGVAAGDLRRAAQSPPEASVPQAADAVRRGAAALAALRRAL